jgi:hypothetical protein
MRESNYETRERREILNPTLKLLPLNDRERDEDYNYDFD